MAFNPKKVDFSNINGGREYTETDIVTPSDFNDVFKSAHYIQKAIEVFGENIDTTEIGFEGVPKAEIVYKTIDGIAYPFLKLSNLKGGKGDSGIGNALLSNDKGESNENGYTQYAINQMVSKPNLLINPDFRVNQRAQTSYIGSNEKAIYTVDRWKLDGLLTVEVVSNGIKLTPKADNPMFYQKIENSEVLIGKDVCISFSIEDNIYVLPVVGLSTSTSVYTQVEGFGIVAFYYERGIFNFVFTTLEAENPNRNAKTINWAKLEIGKMPTLFSPPVYAEELLKCQRYYQKLTIDTVILKGKYLPQVSVPLTTSLRPQYTISKSYLSTEDGANSFVISNSYLYSNVINIQLSPVGSFSPEIGKVYNVYSADNGIILDGEL